MEHRPILLYAICLEIKTSYAQLKKKENDLRHGSLHITGVPNLLNSPLLVKCQFK